MSNVDYQKNVIEMKNITKKFGTFKANDNISLKVCKGEVHALLGENGAGKSTLMNILYGLYKADEGEILIEGKKVNIQSPTDAIKNGIGMVHQHFMLIQPFTVTQNIILGMEPTKNIKLDLEKAKKNVIELSNKYGLHVDPDVKVEDISVGMQQRVEILKVLYRGANIIILDEPTAVITPQEIIELMDIIKNLTNEGKVIIIITHKLKEIKSMADNCTIIRRGKSIDTVRVSEVSESDLASKMVGRSINLKVDKVSKNKGKVLLSIKDLVVNNNRNMKVVNNLSLELHEGEILGIAGVDGNGQSELVEAITGLRNIESGTVSVDGVKTTNAKPKEVINKGMSCIPEDRHKRGLVLDFTIEENIVLENFDRKPFSKKGILNKSEIKSHAKKLIQEFDIRPTNEEEPVRVLSGGNQQKVIIAREVTHNPKVLIATQPTRGLDVGAIEYVHKVLIEQRNKNKAVLLVSLELDEIINIADRIAVIYEGSIAAIIEDKDVDESKIGLLMAGGK